MRINKARRIQNSRIPRAREREREIYNYSKQIIITLRTHTRIKITTMRCMCVCLCAHKLLKSDDLSNPAHCGDQNLILEKLKIKL